MPGRIYPATPTVTKNLFTGKERDSETNWDYFGARYYSAALGRWLSVDPLWEKYPSLSPYAFTANNPVNHVERDGQFFDIVIDVASIVYDIYDIASTAISGEKVSRTQVVALVADVAGALIPGATGGGAAVRAASKVDEVVDLGKGAEKAADLVKSSEKIDDVASESQKITEGIYEVTAESGKPYVGQSANIDARLKQHVKEGKVSPTEAAKAKRTEVKGGKTARKVAEQKRIDELGGIASGKLENIRNPIGEKRKHLLKEEK